MSGRTTRRHLAGLLLLTIFVVAIVFRPEPSFLIEFIDRSGSWGPALFWAVGVALMSTCVPKTVMSILAGSLFGPYLGTALMWFIATTAAGINFKIGAWWWTFDADDSSWTHRLALAAKEAGFGTHLLIRLSPIPTMLISYGCGAAGSRWRPYLAAASVAVVPQSLWVIAGSKAADATLDPSAVTGPTKWISVAIAILAALVFAVWIPAKLSRQIPHSDTM